MHKEREEETQTTTMKQNSCELKMNKNQQGKIFRYLAAHNFFIRVFLSLLKKGKNCFRLLLSRDGCFEKILFSSNQQVFNPCHTFRHSLRKALLCIGFSQLKIRLNVALRRQEKVFFSTYTKKRLFFSTFEQQHRYSVKTNPQKLN